MRTDDQKWLAAEQKAKAFILQYGQTNESLINALKAEDVEIYTQSRTQTDLRRKKNNDSVRAIIPKSIQFPGHQIPVALIRNIEDKSPSFINFTQKLERERRLGLAVIPNALSRYVLLQETFRLFMAKEGLFNGEKSPTENLRVQQGFQTLQTIRKATWAGTWGSLAALPAAMILSSIPVVGFLTRSLSSLALPVLVTSLLVEPVGKLYSRFLGNGPNNEIPVLASGSDLATFKQGISTGELVRRGLEHTSRITEAIKSNANLFGLDKASRKQLKQHTKQLKQYENLSHYLDRQMF